MPPDSSRNSRWAPALLAVLAFGGPWAIPAGAVISATTTIDGPSEDIVAVDGVAMAEDGTGGVVYRKRVDGKARIFAARLSGGTWAKPQRLDVGQLYESSWPVIAAGDGGRLVVAWTHPFATGIDRMYFAALDPGATRFQRPQVLDPNVGVAAYTFPSIAMNRGGQGLLAYRVVVNDQPGPSLPPGYVDGEIRLARYSGSQFSLAGVTMDRDAAQPQRTPDALNGPRVGIALDGSGVVAWQEPDDDFHDRIWVRRVFAGSTSVVQAVSPTTLGDAPMRADADAFALTMTGFGALGVAVRQQPPGADQGGFTRARVYLNSAPEQFDDKAFAFTGSQAVDGGGEDGPADGPLGVPSVGMSGDGTYAIAFGVGGRNLLVEGRSTASEPAALAEGVAPIAGDPLVARAESGAVAAAWKTEVEGAGAISVLERGADGTPLRRLLSAEAGGATADLRLAAGALGDSAVAFLQGEGDRTTVNGAIVDAPPGAFSVSTPPTWTRQRVVDLQWDPSPSGVTGVTYAVLVDDEEIATGLRALRHPLRPVDAEDGPHTVKVVAEDAAGQQTDSTTADLLVDRTAPRVRVNVDRRTDTVTVRVRDGAKGGVSGLADSATTVRWGEPDKPRSKRPARSQGTTLLRHTYRSRGSFPVRIAAVDRAGNRRVVTKRVRP